MIKEGIAKEKDKRKPMEIGDDNIQNVKDADEKDEEEIDELALSDEDETEKLTPEE